MKRKIIWISGIKGGIGKSMLSILLADYCHHRSLQPLIVEADGMVPDVGRRYDGVLPGILAPLGGDDPAAALYELLEKLETTIGLKQIKRVVVNLPANSRVVEDSADEIQAVTGALGFENCTAFLISEAEDSPLLFARSCESGLCSISSTKAVVVNGHFGRTPDKFAWFASEARNDWSSTGGVELFLPDLRARVRELPLLARGFLSAYITPGCGLSIVNQMLLRAFVQAGFAVGDSLEGVTNSEVKK